MRILKAIGVVVLLVLLFVGYQWSRGASDTYKYNRYKKQEKTEFIEWRSCRQDSDCEVALAGCYSWQPINKKYSKDLRGFYMCMASTLPEGDKPLAACVNSRCEATNKDGVVLKRDRFGELK